MDLKAIIRKITPPILLDLYRRRRTTYLWEGVYPDFRTVATIGESRRNESWRRLALKATLKAGLCTTTPTEVLPEYAFFSILAAMVCRLNRGRLRVLDFGGGLGISYAHLVSSLVACPGIDYHVIELRWACREGCRLFEQDGRIHFHHSPPDKLPNVDIVLVKNALEYVDDYAGVLKTLCAYRATWFLFLELFAGDFPTYASAQLNMPGTVMPCWFTNANEIIGIMEQCGHALILEGVMDERVNQDNFPEEFRLPTGRPSMMLFALPHSGGAQQEPVSELR